MLPTNGRPDPPRESTRRSSAGLRRRGLGAARTAPSPRRRPRQQTHLKLQAGTKVTPSQGPLPASSCSPRPASSLVPPLPGNKSVPAVVAQTADARASCLAFWVFTGAHSLEPFHRSPFGAQHRLLQPQGLGRFRRLVPRAEHPAPRALRVPCGLRLRGLRLGSQEGGVDFSWMGHEGCKECAVVPGSRPSRVSDKSIH